MAATVGIAAAKAVVAHVACRDRDAAADGCLRHEGRDIDAVARRPRSLSSMLRGEAGCRPRGGITASCPRGMIRSCPRGTVNSCPRGSMEVVAQLLWRRAQALEPRSQRSKGTLAIHRNAPSSRPSYCHVSAGKQEGIFQVASSQTLPRVGAVSDHPHHASSADFGRIHASSFDRGLIRISMERGRGGGGEGGGGGTGGKRDDDLTWRAADARMDGAYCSIIRWGHVASPRVMVGSGREVGRRSGRVLPHIPSLQGWQSPMNIFRRHGSGSGGHSSLPTPVPGGQSGSGKDELSSKGISSTRKSLTSQLELEEGEPAVGEKKASFNGVFLLLLINIGLCIIDHALKQAILCS
ncbi:hypothetical protein CBR_g61488 [Chara braunii]|uniref:Uncharacterized protein n=1 Tax=Chara braunii TaxID=69332 RepID=A0A388K8R8_CHABU|nr:hypothetical protein CBR_g61488 [Chara braunii]|eukprot:GBG66445.1 hypothetical protein CBR_g61488 [Chara braunii]